MSHSRVRTVHLGLLAKLRPLVPSFERRENKQQLWKFFCYRYTFTHSVVAWIDPTSKHIPRVPGSSGMAWKLWLFHGESSRIKLEMIFISVRIVCFSQTGSLCVGNAEFCQVQGEKISMQNPVNECGLMCTVNRRFSKNLNLKDMELCGHLL